MGIWIGKDGLYFSGDLYWFIRERAFRYITIYTTPNYGYIKIEFHRREVPRCYSIIEKYYYYKVRCKNLAYILRKLNASVTDYKIEDNSIIITTNLARIEREKTFLPVIPFEKLPVKREEVIYPRVFSLLRVRGRPTRIVFVGEVGKWIKENGFKCVEVYAEEARIPMYLEFHFYREEECTPDMGRIVISAKGGLPELSSTALAKYLDRFKLVPRDYEIVGNVLRVWLTFRSL